MPICPRCGKSLTTEQALCYHLSKKVRCDKWTCARCNHRTSSKPKLIIHESKCYSPKRDLCKKRHKNFTNFTNTLRRNTFPE